MTNNDKESWEYEADKLTERLMGLVDPQERPQPKVSNLKMNDDIITYDLSLPIIKEVTK